MKNAPLIYKADVFINALVEDRYVKSNAFAEKLVWAESIKSQSKFYVLTGREKP